MPSLGGGLHFPKNARTRVSAGSYSGLHAFSVLRGIGAGWMEGVAIVGSRIKEHCILYKAA